MRVAIGAVAGTIGGPATYAVELVRALVAEFPEDSFVVLSDRTQPFADVAETVHLPLPSAWWQPVWDHVRVSAALRKGDFDLYHATKGILPRTLPSLVELPPGARRHTPRGLATALPAVVTIHDLAERVMPETFSRAQRLHLRMETPATLARASAVITVSKHSAADLQKYFPLSEIPVRVVPHGVSHWARRPDRDEVEAWKRRRSLTGRAVGYLGTIQPRKNLDLLAEAFRQAAGGEPLQLWIAGRGRPGYRPRCFDGGDTRIRYLGALPEVELPLFLASLECMVSPSAYEGFGLTFLEAMACGVPVIGLRNSAVHEVVGDAGLLIESGGAAALADAMVSLLKDRQRARELADRGLERAASFSWQRAAQQTRAVYQEAAGGALR